MFLIAGTAVLIVAVVSAVTVRGSRTKQGVQMKTETPSRRGIVSELAPVLLIQLPYGFVFSFIVTILPGYALKSGLTPFEVGVILSAFGLARIAAFSQAGRFAGFGERRSIILASAGIAFALIVAPLGSSFFGFLTDIFLLGLFMGIFYPQVIGYIGRRAPPANLGFSMGLYEAAVGIGFALGPVTSGFIAEAAGVYVTYVILSAAAFSMIPMVAFTKPRRTI
jgi:MFS family permease